MVGNIRTLLGKAMILKLLLSATADNDDVMLGVFVDDEQIFQSAATVTQQTVTHEISELPGDHVLRLEMSGKTKQHTQVNSSGEIMYDVAFLVNALEFEDIDMTPVLYPNNPCYKHNLNGSAEERVDEFSGFMGCNGTASFEFSTPIYLWMYGKI
jgi:hypothetical protein